MGTKEENDFADGMLTATSCSAASKRSLWERVVHKFISDTLPLMNIRAGLSFTSSSFATKEIETLHNGKTVTSPVISILKTPVSPYGLEKACIGSYKVKQTDGVHPLAKVKRKLKLDVHAHIDTETNFVEGCDASSKKEKIIRHAKYFASVVESENQSQRKAANAFTILPQRSVLTTPVKPRSWELIQSAESDRTLSLGNDDFEQRLLPKRVPFRAPPTSFCVTSRAAAKQQTKIAKIEKSLMMCCSRTPMTPAVTKPALSVLVGVEEKIPPLPRHLQQLLEIFSACEMVLRCNRRPRCLMPSLQYGVQKILNMPLTNYKFGQLISVYPEAYVCYATTLSDAETIELQIHSTHPILHNTRVIAVMPNFMHTIATEPPLVSEPFLPCHVAARRACFTRRLIGYVERYHAQFLSFATEELRCSLDDLLTNVPAGEWHPEFPLDAVPDVVSARFDCGGGFDVVAEYKTHVQPTTTSVTSTTTSDAQSMLRAAAAIHNERVNKDSFIRTHISEACRENAVQDDVSPTGAAEENIVNQNVVENKFSGGKQNPRAGALLDRVRQRSAARQKHLAARDSLYADKLVLLEAMPDAARLVRSFFLLPSSTRGVASNRKCVSLTSLLNYLCRAQPQRGVNARAFFMQVLENMSQLTPEWISVRSNSAGPLATTKNVKAAVQHAPVKFAYLSVETDFCQILSRINALKNQYAREGRWELLFPEASA